jgi:hypothetical protein
MSVGSISTQPKSRSEAGRHGRPAASIGSPLLPAQGQRQREPGAGAVRDRAEEVRGVPGGTTRAALRPPQHDSRASRHSSSQA